MTTGAAGRDAVAWPGRAGVRAGAERWTLGGLLRLALAVGAAGFVAQYVAVALLRLRHPFELNWMEGAMVEHVARVVAGQPLYVAPSLDFVPFLYPPLYHYAAAAVASLTGVGFLPLRLVSLVASLGVVALAYAFVARETRDRVAGLAAAGLFAATYSLGGAYLDVGRVDSLFLLLLFGGTFVLRFHPSVLAHAAAGALVGLAFHTKQSALVMAAPVLLLALWRRPRAGLAAIVTAGAVAWGGALLLDAASDGWYRYYVLDIPAGVRFHAARLVDFWRVDVLPPLAIAWALGLLHLLRRGDDAGGADGRSRAAAAAHDPRAFHLLLAVGLLAGAWIPRGNLGGNDNVLIPAFLAAALLFGLGVHAARAAAAELSPGARRLAAVWLGVVCLLQLGTLAWNPRHRLPTAADVAAGHALVRTAAAADGEIWVPYQGHLAALAGKRTGAHWMAITQVLERTEDPLAARLQREIDDAIRARRWSLVLMSSGPFPNSPTFEPAYEAAGSALTDSDALWPVTGARRRVETLYVPHTTP